MQREHRRSEVPADPRRTTLRAGEARRAAPAPTHPLLHLQRTAGNRAVARALRSRPATPTPVQRFSFTNPDFARTKSVFMHGSGMFGVAIFRDGTENPLVVKASAEDVNETILASTFHKKITGKMGGIDAVPIRSATAAERATITEQVKSMVPNERFQQIAEKSDKYPSNAELRPGFVARMRKSMLDGYDEARNAVFIQGFASGQDFKEIAGSTQRRNNLSLLLRNRDYVKRLGRVHAADMFLGNNDRLDAMNLGNWMTTLGGQDNAITLIDNFDPMGNQKLTPGAQDVWMANNLPKLLNTRQTAEQAINGETDSLMSELRKTGVDIERLYPNHDQLVEVVIGAIDAFDKGMREGIDVTLSKLAPRIGRASRTMKAATMARGATGAEAWTLLKQRAQVLRKRR